MNYRNTIELFVKILNKKITGRVDQNMTKKFKHKFRPPSLLERIPELDKDTLDSAIKLVESGVSPTNTAKQLHIGRSTLYRELKYAR